MKMKIIKLITVVGWILTTFMLAACSTVTDPAETYKGESPTYIFQKGEKSLAEKSYTDAIKRFEALEVQYPFGHDTEIAELHLIYAYYMSSDYASSEAAADRFVHAHLASPHVDYAYYMRGLANYYQNLGIFERLFAVNLATRDLTQIKKSFIDFSHVVRFYPNSCYAPAAHQYMIYLRNILADYQMGVAQYYFQRKAYVAAADRANIIVRHYQGTPVVPQALAMMIKSYRALQLTQLEQDTLAVFRYNYPSLNPEVIG